MPGHAPTRLDAAWRAQAEAQVALLLDLLDALEPDVDAEAEHEGCCDAADDDAASSKPYVLNADHWPGDADDAEHSLGHADAEGHGYHLHSGEEGDGEVDDEAETDMDLGDEPMFPHRDWVHQQANLRVGCLPGDQAPVRHLDEDQRMARRVRLEFL